MTSSNGSSTETVQNIVGGLVGTNYGSIVQAYALGNVTGGANTFVAGLVGTNYGTIDQTYAAGKVTAGAGSTTGGLVAYNAPATVNGPISTEGGFNAFFVNSPAPSSAPSVTNSFWDTTTTGQTTSAGDQVQGLTTAQLTSGTLLAVSVFLLVLANRRGSMARASSPPPVLRRY